MTEYWKSVGNYYCDYCKVFVRNDAFSRRQHEASPRHEGALKRQVRDIHRKNEREAKELAQVNRELARIGGKTALPAKQVEVQTQRASRPKKADTGIKTLDDGDVYRAALAQHAIPGQWTSTSTAAEEDEEKEEELILETKDQDAESKDGSIPIASHSLTANTNLKRRHDGADEELIQFRVEQKKDIAIADDRGEDAPVISFKKKKKKPSTG